MKEPEIIGDDYPTYEEIVKAHKTTPHEDMVNTAKEEELTEHIFGSYDHMLDTFDWWHEYLAQNGPNGTINIATEIIKYADRLKSVNSCCQEDGCGCS